MDTVGEALGTLCLTIVGSLVVIFGLIAYARWIGTMNWEGDEQGRQITKQMRAEDRAYVRRLVKDHVDMVIGGPPYPADQERRAAQQKADADASVRYWMKRKSGKDRTP